MQRGRLPAKHAKGRERKHGKFEKDSENDVSIFRLELLRRCNDRSSPINLFPVPFSRVSRASFSFSFGVSWAAWRPIKHHPRPESRRLIL